MCRLFLLAYLSVHCEFSHRKFHKLRRVSTLNQNIIFVIISLSTTYTRVWNSFRQDYQKFQRQIFQQIYLEEIKEHAAENSERKEANRGLAGRPNHPLAGRPGMFFPLLGLKFCVQKLPRYPSDSPKGKRRILVLTPANLFFTLLLEDEQPFKHGGRS